MPKTKSRKSARTGDTYMELVRRFPLKTIKNDDEHEEATSMISELMGRDLDSGAGDYLDTLLVLVNKYEDDYHAIDETMTPREALRSLMESNTLSQADIGRIIGSESAVSMFLKGDRDLSKSQIKKLADRFKVDASLFFG
ncbi:MAG TPA: helix-turn-helix domain-containing protein [Tepidisphaeraceae bacterium]|jgi:HTH-type transcriptional regulator/antitoxin HigA|nr:helix-turn-helix domain-containing protein [Tepidisphaeraceae bacterium]